MEALSGLPDIPGAEHRYAEIQTADAGPLRVHYAEAGSGPPVLLVHGWPQHFWCWRRVVPLLADSYRLICPDLRGFGWSAAPGRGYDSETFAADQIALLDALGLDRVRLIGHDWGGFSSFIVALRHPERVERLLVLSAPIPWARPGPRALLSIWRIWYVVMLAAVGRRLMAQRPGPIPRGVRQGPTAAAIDEAAAEIYAAPLRRPEQAHATQLLYRAYLAAVKEPGRFDDMRLTVPTHLMLGAKDPAIAPVLIEGWEPHADQMSAELVPGAGHFLPEEVPELVASRLARLVG